MSRTTRFLVISFAGIAAVIASMVFGITTLPQETRKAKQPQVEKTPPPDADYNHAPTIKFDPADYFFSFDQLEEAYRAPGEHTHRLDGETYGFDSLSFIVTKTQPNGGPNLHVHDVEEAHVLLDGRAEYRIGDKTFIADAPYIVKVPAGMPHTFINAGTKPFNLVAVFASKKLTSKRLGPNPLVHHATPKK
jgi:mannose-6-phosphate isomerase-like protein (cupin superfamily)